MANIAGDPFTASRPYHQATKWVEQNVLDYFASLWNAKCPHDPNDPESYWGYVLSMGSSEGNIHALWSARNYLTIDGNKEPVLFFSRNTNFSSKLVKVKQFHEVGKEQYPNENPLEGEWVAGVPCTGGSLGPGTISIDDLERLVDFFSAKGHPIIVIFNYGTTLKGRCDDVKSAGEKLVQVRKKNNMYERTLADPVDSLLAITRKKFWFHVDGALSAAYMPFLQMAYENDLTDIVPGSIFDFRLDFVSSIVTSGHEFIGTPWPCGVYLTRNSLLCSKQPDISVIGSTDITISVSRNAHSAFLLWSYISHYPYNAQVTSILRCLKLVPYAIHQLKVLEKMIGIDLRILNYAPSLSILFRKPNMRIVLKYALTVLSLHIDGKEYHAVCADLCNETYNKE